MKLITILLSLLVPCTMYAQPTAESTPQPLPSGPLLKRAPEFSQWVVTFTQKKDKAEPGASPSKQAEPKQTVVTKTKTIYHEESLNTLGQKRDSWRVGSLQITSLPGSQTRTMVDASSFGEGGPDASTYTDYSKTDFPGFDWISAKYYVEIKKVMDVDCMVFHAAPDVEAAAIAGVDPLDMTAYINLSTRLPVVLLQGNETRVYQFGPPPSGMLTLPADLQETLNQRTKSIEPLSYKPARPY